MNKLSRSKREDKLEEKLDENPFLTDQELADFFGVSIQTIRLDRMRLNIPEVRKRIKDVAQDAYSKVKSVQSGEIIGQLVEIKLNQQGSSILKPTEELLLEKSQVVRGHHIFAQANSLAVAIIDTDAALTGSADIKYHRPVKLGEKLLAMASVKKREENKFFVEVKTKVNQEIVFSGQFIIFAVENQL